MSSRSRHFHFQSGVRVVWLRHDVDHAQTLTLEGAGSKVAQEGLILTESQLAALERRQWVKEENGELGSSARKIYRSPSPTC